MERLLDTLDWLLAITVGKFVCYLVRRGHGGDRMTMERDWLRDGSWVDRCNVCWHTESSRD